MAEKLRANQKAILTLSILTVAGAGLLQLIPWPDNTQDMEKLATASRAAIDRAHKQQPVKKDIVFVTEIYNGARNEIRFAQSFTTSKEKYEGRDIYALIKVPMKGTVDNAAVAEYAWGAAHGKSVPSIPAAIAVYTMDANGNAPKLVNADAAEYQQIKKELSWGSSKFRAAQTTCARRAEELWPVTGQGKAANLPLKP